jgi:hypothetical protein
MDQQMLVLDQAVKKAAEENEKARLLMTQPGVGPITSLAYVLTMGDVSRFQRGKQVASYLGLIPKEYSSAGKQRMGRISKQGNRFILLCDLEEASYRELAEILTIPIGTVMSRLARVRKAVRESLRMASAKHESA